MNAWLTVNAGLKLVLPAADEQRTTILRNQNENRDATSLPLFSSGMAFQVQQEYGEAMTAQTENQESFVPIFTSGNHDAEMEALTIQGILEASDIPTMLVGPHMLPNLDFQVHVPEHLVEKAQEVIAEARKAGTSAAEEAELASEK